MKEGTFIFANGAQLDPARLKGLIHAGDTLIAADGGLRFLKLLGLQPDLLIGDLDSLSPEEIEQAECAGIEVHRFPVHKNETDLELAIDAAVKGGARRIRIAAALGGRLDMTLGNLFLLTLPELEGLDVRLDDGLEEVFLIRPADRPAQIQGEPGDRVSLLPLNGPATGIRTEGLYYPLRSETLYPQRTRGISNVLLGNEAGVSLESGLLLCIHTRLATQAESSEGELKE